MFKDLRTGPKLIILCGFFTVSIAVTTYGLIAEKWIAIDFARKELIGTHYLSTIRNIYAAVLFDKPVDSSAEILNALAFEQAQAGAVLETAELESALAAALRQLWSGKASGGDADTLAMDALAKARSLIARIGDDSNLTLDTDLDSYYAQNIAVVKLPAVLGRLGEVQALLHATASAGTTSTERSVQYLLLDSLLRSGADGLEDDLTAAYRGNADGSLRRSADAPIAAVISSVNAYLSAARANLIDGPAGSIDSPALDHLFTAAVDSALKAWMITQGELDRLLAARIDDLMGKLRRSLMLIGLFGGLSIAIALMTHRHIVRPLRRLERLARTVRETKNYNLRVDDVSRDEIGRLAVAFNEMLSELAAAREREAADQAELARVTRLTTMGQMAASLAHEINQPLGAIVANGNAGLRWLARETPDIDEARAALQDIVGDGHRASEVIGSVRAIFNKDGQQRSPLDVNDLIREVLALLDGKIRTQGIRVQTKLIETPSRVLANRVQVQQVVLNLITNAVDAMSSVTDRARVLRVTSKPHEADRLLVMVEDSGIGIDAKNVDRIFDAFFTTKSQGMGMGLSICRSIIESYNGRLWVSPGARHGSIFHLVLPASGIGAE
jgi:signal transduction histidine kinase